MTVNELIAELSELQQNGCGKYIVIKSSDDEGNDFIKINELSITNADHRNYHIEIVNDEEFEVLKASYATVLGTSI